MNVNTRETVLKRSGEGELFAWHPLPTMLPPYYYGKKLTSLLGSILNPLFSTVSWSMHRELEKHLKEINQSRADKIQYLIAVVPPDSLGSTTSGETIEGSNVARVREDRQWSALHEFLHMLRLYEKGAEQYDLPSGSDAYGNQIENGSGAIVMECSAYVPRDAGGSSACNRHYPAGHLSGVFDIMGTCPQKWPALSTLEAAFTGLGLTPPAIETTSAPTPHMASAFAVEPTASAPPGTRRVLFMGLAERNPTDLSMRLISGSIICRDVTTVMPDPISPSTVNMDVKLIIYDADLNTLGEVWCKAPPRNESLTLWQQTFDLPEAAAGYHIRIYSTNDRLFVQWDAGAVLSNGLTGISAGQPITDATVLNAVAPGDPVQSQLYMQVGGGNWTPLSEVFSGNSDLSLSAMGLPKSSQIALKLLSSDGFNRAETVIGPLSVPNRAPQVSLMGPTPGTWAPTGTVWALSAKVVDAEEGALTNGQWQSSRDGILGSGAFLNGIILSAGKHELVFTASDSDSATASVTGTVNVVEDNVVDLHVAESHLSWTRGAKDDSTLFPNTPLLGAPNTISVRLPAPPAMEAFHARMILTTPGFSPESVIDELVESDENGIRSLVYSFAPVAQGTYRVTVEVDPPEGTTDQNLADNSYTWEFPNQAPVCKPQVVYCSPQQPIEVALFADDPEGTAVSFQIVRNPQHGALSGTLPDLIYKAGSYIGDDYMEITASDGLAVSPATRITFRVAAPAGSPALPLSSSFEVAAGQPFEHKIPFYFGATNVQFFGTIPAGISIDVETGVLSGTLQPPGNVSLTILAYNAAGYGFGSLTIHVDQSFTWWIGQQNVPAGGDGAGDDPDGDRIPNLYEYAFGLDAMIPSVFGRPYLQQSANGVELVFRQRPEGVGSFATPYSADGVLYEVEICNDLTTGEWEKAKSYIEYTGMEEDGDPAINTVRVRLNDYVDPKLKERAFFRVIVTEEP